MTQLFVLFEHASGYGLFRVREFEEVGMFLPEVEAAVSEVGKFQQVVKLVGYRAFTSATSALENINAISEGLVTQELQAFLETNLPKVGKKSGVTLGVTDPKLGAAINEAIDVTVTHIGVVPEVLRGIRTHLHHFVKGLNSASMKQTELGLGHSYSRGKVKFNVHRVDNMIIQSIALVDQLDKDVNTFAMRIKEWYSYHFPELAKIVTDNHQYGMCARFIRDRKTLTEESLPELEAIVMDSAKAQAILDGARMSMGMDISPIDLLNIERFAKRVVSLSEYRKQLAEYLRKKMSQVAPNLATLIGEVVGARLISHAGSLTNLAKYPASTVQILGAEKALFRAIKTRSNTPKYGLIFHSSFISRAGTSNKGRISRYLANKCSIASRIDCFSEILTNVFGEHLRDQVEERLKFYETGDIPRKNAEVMKEALDLHNTCVKQEEKQTKKRKIKEEMNGDVPNSEEVPKKKKKRKKQQAVESELVPENGVKMEEVNTELKSNVEEETKETVEEPTEVQQVKKKKKKKQQQQQEVENVKEEPQVEVETESPQKKKKKRKKDEAVEVPSEQVVEELNEEPKKKKKKKEVAVEMNGGEELLEEEASPVKKKKKKKQQVEVNNLVVEAIEVVPEAPKKKKKKKSIAESV